MGAGASMPCPIGNAAFLADGPDHVIICLNAHGQCCPCCCPNFCCPSCGLPEPVHFDTFRQRPFGAFGGGGHGSEIVVPRNTWAQQPGAFPSQLSGRVEPLVWQQFITEISLLFMQQQTAGNAAMLVPQVEAKYGPLLNASFIGNGTYQYEYWFDGTPPSGDPPTGGEPAGWRVASFHFVQITWPPRGGFVMAAPMGQPVAMAPQAAQMQPMMAQPMMGQPMMGQQPNAMYQQQQGMPGMQQPGMQYQQQPGMQGMQQPGIQYAQR